LEDIRTRLDSAVEAVGFLDLVVEPVLVCASRLLGVVGEHVVVRIGEEEEVVVVVAVVRVGGTAEVESGEKVEVVEEEADTATGRLSAE
jgi:hypothetical protein